MKRLISMILCLTFALTLAIPAYAFSAEEKNTADALNSLQLFLGLGNDENGNPVYGLDQSLTREQGVMLLLRMLGQEETAKNYTGSHPFTDVTNHYYDPYIAYAYSTGLVKGTGETTFDGDMAMNLQMFATFCMRPLGYQDGEGADFLYSNAVAFAQSKGVSKISGNQDFTRGDAVTMFWQTLNAACKGSTETLADTLIANGLFTAEAFAKAKDIQENGKSTDSDTSTDSGSSSSGGGSSGGSSTGDSGGSTGGGSSDDGGKLPSDEEQFELPEIEL